MFLLCLLGQLWCSLTFITGWVFSEANAETKLGVQDVYLRSVPGKASRKNWAEGENELQCRPHKALDQWGALGQGLPNEVPPSPCCTEMAGPLYLTARHRLPQNSHDLKPRCCLQPRETLKEPSAESCVLINLPIAEQWTLLEWDPSGTSLGVPHHWPVIVKRRKAPMYVIAKKHIW